MSGMELMSMPTFSTSRASLSSTSPSACLAYHWPVRSKSMRWADFNFGSTGCFGDVGDMLFSFVCPLLPALGVEGAEEPAQPDGLRVVNPGAAHPRPELVEVGPRHALLGQEQVVELAEVESFAQANFDLAVAGRLLLGEGVVVDQFGLDVPGRRDDVGEPEQVALAVLAHVLGP